MTDLLRILCDYAHEHQMLFYEDQAQYKESQSMERQNYDELCRLLSPEGLQRLENYASEAAILRSLELEAMFRAGLSMGLELSRI